MKTNLFKKLLAFVLVTLMLAALATPLTAAAYDNTVSVSISGYNSSPGTYGVTVFTNTGSSAKTVYVANYSFREAKLLIFNGSGKLIEAGNGLFANSSTVTGSPQSKVIIPAGGFMVVFGNSASTSLTNVYNVALEGAVIYNATMSVIYDVYGSYSTSTNKLTIQYNNPKAPSANAKKFMFIGNSSTYFNGTPIKFKGLAQAAGVEIDVDYCTYGSAMLWEFASSTHERGVAMRNMLANNKYDYVVIQGEASATYDKVKDYVHTIVSEINKNGAEPLLYMRYSAASTLEQNTINAKKHYDTYTALATEYDLRVSPAADAFIFCHAKYPSITLYAEDGGHHSKEGSYLIGCVWLYSYLGIDPTGNTYTADMDATTVARLQECAKLAVEQGYPYPGRYNTYTANGTTYQNIALGKSYVSDGAAYGTATWTDTGSNGKPLGKLTDGKFATLGNDKAIGAYNGNNVNIDIDLKAYSDIKAIKTTLFGNNWGIANPNSATVNVSVSNDGVNYKSLGTASKSNSAVTNGWTSVDFTLAAPANTTARYVRFNIVNMVCTWTSELSVYGVLGTPIVDQDPDFETAENIALGKKYTISGNGKPYAQYTANLTDGNAYTAIAYDNNWFTFYNNGDDATIINAPNGVGSIIIDLEDLYDVTKVMVNTIDLQGDSGINPPKSMKVYFSKDGESWGNAIPLTIPTTQKGVAYLVQAETKGVARYVKLEVELNGVFAFINEIKINGEESDEPVNPPVDPPVNPPVNPPVDPEVKLGDVNNDDAIDQYDYILVKRHYFETRTLTDDEFTRADVNGDEKVDQFDYILIARHYFGTYVIK